MIVTLFGIVTDKSELQPLKASIPILDMLFVRLIEVSPLQPWNASSPFIVTGKIITL